jgi:hypothetical protein
MVHWTLSDRFVERPERPCRLVRSSPLACSKCVALRRPGGGFGLSGTSKIMRNLLHNAVSRGLSSSSTREMYCPGQFGPISLFSITGHQHQQSQGKLAVLQFLRSFGMATKAFRKRGFSFSLTTNPLGTTAGTGRALSRDVQGSAIGQLLGEAAVWL